MPDATETPCMINVLVTEPDGTVIHDERGNHYDKFFRDWITRTEWWAMRNGKTVTKKPL